MSGLHLADTYLKINKLWKKNTQPTLSTKDLVFQKKTPFALIFWGFTDSKYSMGCEKASLYLPSGV